MFLFAAVCLTLVQPVPRLLAQAPPSFEPAGFVTVSGYGLDKLTGGGNSKVIEVRTAAEFRAAVERSDIKKKADREKAPRVVRVMADIDLGVLGNER